jgi:hypothetical protein
MPLVPFSAFVGISLSDAVQVDHTYIVSFTSYGGGGNNRKLAKVGAREILPWHYSQLGRLIRSGAYRVDVLWAAAGFKDTLLRCQMKREVANGDEKKIQPGVQA